MSVVNITEVNVLDNPALFTAPYRFDITFESLADLSEDLEWKVIYVGSAQSEENDQILESIMVGPVPRGTNRFIFEADAPDPQRIPPSELLGVTVVLLTCAYKGKEFVRVGYYVNVEYADEELRTNPPAQPIIEKLYRSVLAEKPKVTRYPIQWDLQESTSGSGMETEPTLSMV